MREKKSLMLFLIVSLTLLLALSPIYAKVGIQKRQQVLNKPTTIEYVQYDANRIRCWIGNEGDIVSYHVTSEAGLEWPKGSGNTAVFQSGIWAIGKVFVPDTTGTGGTWEIRSAVVEYSSEYLPGTVMYNPHPDSIAPGIPNNPSDVRYQVYSINKGDVSDPESPNYNREWATWPIADGAPGHDGEYFTDSNGNGVYDEGESYEDYNLNGQYDGPDGVIIEGEDPPLLLGDQMHWYVYNDFDQATHGPVFNTKPLGIEVQTTVFGFDRADPLGDVMFMKWLIINKSGQTIKDMYISMWSDSDVGDATDDYVGCDTTLSVGYTYNGKTVDMIYGTAVPAVGYDFFQGPIVPSPGDSALVSGRVIYDYKNLGMTSFVKYTNGGAPFDDPETAEEAYNYMQGFQKTGDPWRDPQGNVVKFLYTGDPVTQTGYTEFDDDVPGDRRFLMSSGPIEMPTWVDENGDGEPQVGEPGVQEVVGAIIIAAGTNNLNSITAMKFFDQYAQNAYDTQFQLPSPPSPVVQVSELDEQIILSWDEGADAIENYSFMGYNFEGYNVYQGESANGPWKLIATYDKVNNVTIIMDMGLDLETGLILEGPVQFGGDNGLARYINITKDAIRGNKKLINGRKYYFAVTSYAYNPDKAPKTVESAKKSIVARPHEPALGQKLLTSTGSRLTIEHSSGVGEAQIYAEVIDPLKLTGKDYAVEFGYDSTQSQGYWYFGTYSDGNLTDTLVVSSQLDSFTTDVIDGFKLTVKDVTFEYPIVYTRWAQTSNVVPTLTDSIDFPAVSPGGVDTLALIDDDTVKVDTLCGEGKYYDNWKVVTIGANDYLRLYRVVKHDLLIGGSAKNLGAPTGLGKDMGLGGGTDDPKNLRADIVFAFTEKGQKATFCPQNQQYQPVENRTIPFEVWDIENNRQLCLAIADNNSDLSLIADSAENKLQNDWLLIIFQDYQEHQDDLQPLFNNENSGWLVFFDPSSKYSVGDSLRLYFLNPVEAGVDQYKFTAPALSTDLTKKELKSQLKKINVFPNPYFAFNVEETQPIQRFVTFTHLPVDKETTIRIFTLAGQFVKKIEHTNGTSFDTWDLTNHNNIPVASGMYIVHIEVKGVGSKVLKLAIFMPEERLDLY